MHLYVIARGAIDKIERWKADLTAQYLPMKLPGGKEGRLQMTIRPVEFLEIIFPEEQLDEALRIVRPLENLENVRFKRVISFLRRYLKLDPVPPYSTDGVLKGPDFTFYRVLKKDVAVIGIGVKKDPRRPDGMENI